VAEGGAADWVPAESVSLVSEVSGRVWLQNPCMPFTAGKRWVAWAKMPQSEQEARWAGAALARGHEGAAREGNEGEGGGVPRRDDVFGSRLRRDCRCPRVDINCVVVLQQSCVGGLAQRNTNRQAKGRARIRISGAIPQSQGTWRRQSWKRATVGFGMKDQAKKDRVVARVGIGDGHARSVHCMSSLDWSRSPHRPSATCFPGEEEPSLGAI
jgi:hypothetical protein